MRTRLVHQSTRRFTSGMRIGPTKMRKREKEEGPDNPDDPALGLGRTDICPKSKS
jgi:hypothetical protein